MTAVVQREQSTTMASMGGFGNNIIVSHRIHRGSQTGTGASRPAVDPGAAAPSTSGPLLITQTQTLPPPQASNPSEQLTPIWGPQVLSEPQVLSDPETLTNPRPTAISLADLDDLFDTGRTDDDSLPGPSSTSLLLSSPSSSSSSSHSPLPGGGGGPTNSYPGDLYSR